MGVDQLGPLRFRNVLRVALGEDRLRADAVHSNLEWAGLGGYVLREDLEACLRSGICDGRSRVRAAPAAAASLP
jgi:hypothetical protein